MLERRNWRGGRGERDGLDGCQKRVRERKWRWEGGDIFCAIDEDGDGEEGEFVFFF